MKIIIFLICNLFTVSVFSGLAQTSETEESGIADRSSVPVSVRVGDDEYSKLTPIIQALYNFSKNIPHEKVYLHFDNTSYYQGDNIWFKCYIVTSDLHQLNALSQTLYVELLNPGGELVDKRILLIENGQCHGEFTLGHLPFYSGFYEVRAYTKYMLNFGEDIIFSRLLPVFNKPKIEGNFEEKEMLSYGKWGGTGNYSMKREHPLRENKVNLRFFPEGGHLVQGVASRIAFEATNEAGNPIDLTGVVLDGNNQEICTLATLREGRGVFTFMPESGLQKNVVEVAYSGSKYRFDLPQALPQGVVMETDNLSHPDEIEITLRKNRHTLSETLGIVIFNGGKLLDYRFTHIEDDEASIKMDRKLLPSGVSQIVLFNSKGEALCDRLIFNSKKDFLSIKATAGKPAYAPYEVVDMEMRLVDSEANPVQATFSLSVRDGANEVEHKHNILTELLLMSEIKGYVRNPSWYFDDDANTENDKNSNDDDYSDNDDNSNGDNSDCDNNSDNDKNSNGDNSVETLHATSYSASGASSYSASGATSHAASDTTSHTTIPSNHRAMSLDILLMVQGWRRYSWDQMTGIAPFELNYLPEQGIETHGRVVSLVRKTPQPNVDVSMLLSQKGEDEETNLSFFETFVTDQQGRFSFRTYETGRWSMILSVMEKGKNKDHFLLVDRDFSPKPGTYRYADLQISIAQNNTAQMSDDETPEVFDDDSVSFLYAYRDSISKIGIDEKLHQLPEVTVRARRRTNAQDIYRNRSTSIAYYDVATEYDNFYDRGYYIGDNMFAFLMKMDHNFHIKIEEDLYFMTSEYLYYKTKRALVVFNHNLEPEAGSEKFVKYNDHYAFLNLIAIKSFYISEDLSTIYKYGGSQEADKTYSCVVFIETYPDGMIPVEGAKGVRKTWLDGYSAVKEFYSPNYSDLTPEPDYRRTLYWNPSITADENGKAKITFYNNSSCTNFSISAETVTPHGMIGIYRND